MITPDLANAGLGAAQSTGRFAIFLFQDIDRSTAGSVTANQQPMIDRY